MKETTNEELLKLYTVAVNNKREADDRFFEINDELAYRGLTVVDTTTVGGNGASFVYGCPEGDDNENN